MHMAEDTGLRPPNAANPDFPLRIPRNIHASQPAASEPARKVSLHVAAVAMLNLADFQNAVPALGELAVRNETPAAISDMTLTVTSEPAFLKENIWHLDIWTPVKLTTSATWTRSWTARCSRLAKVERSTLLQDGRRWEIL